MRTALSGLSLHQPATIASALKLMRGDPPPLPIAGCTDVFVQLNFGTLKETQFIDLSRIGTLRRIVVHDAVLSIGATASYAEIMRSRLVRQRLPMLVAAAREIGGPQIQARGTIGGNVANASPAGDTLPVLAAADALVVLASADGERRVPFTEFSTGYRMTVRRPEELVVAIEVPIVDGQQWFRKVGTRAAQAISKLVMAGVRRPAAAPSLAIGSVAPTVIRLPRTEAALGSGASVAAAQRILAEEIQPIDDVRSTAEYRRRVASNLLERFWTETA
ncbi:MAG: FAD binding domain-containing protein [Gemmatimonadaceae bacterium]